MICCVSKYPITKRVRNLANQKWIQISLQTCGISEQALGAIAQTVYTGGCRLSATQAMGPLFTFGDGHPLTRQQLSSTVQLLVTLKHTLVIASVSGQ